MDCGRFKILKPQMLPQEWCAVGSAEFFDWALQEFADEFPGELIAFCDGDVVAHSTNPLNVISDVKTFAREKNRCIYSDLQFAQMPPLAETEIEP